jgi:hypothetical protein
MSAEIIAGVDESPESLRATEFAAYEARIRNVGLRIVHVIEGPPLDEPVRPPMRLADRVASLAAADTIIAAALERAAVAAPTVQVSSSVMTGRPAVALTKAAAGGVALVVGRRPGYLAKLSSTATIGSMVARSPCPVMIAQGAVEAGTNVIVGVGTSAATEWALAFAFAEASLRGVGLTAVHAWRSPVLATHGVAGGLRVAGEEASNLEAARILSEALAGWGARFPEVTVRRAVPEGSTIGALTRASVSAQMLVVGARHAPALRSSAIAHEIIRRAMCPIVVVPEPTATTMEGQ